MMDRQPGLMEYKMGVFFGRASDEALEKFTDFYLRRMNRCMKRGLGVAHPERLELDTKLELILRESDKRELLRKVHEYRDLPWWKKLSAKKPVEAEYLLYEEWGVVA